MTAAALGILEQNKAGFLLMVEGSLIDSRNHEENLDYQFGEMKAFDQAVKVVFDWITAKPGRQEDTLLVILPDHETGGFAVKGVGPKRRGEPECRSRSVYRRLGMSSHRGRSCRLRIPSHRRRRCDLEPGTVERTVGQGDGEHGPVWDCE
jgi:alkaline phosphatase